MKLFEVHLFAGTSVTVEVELEDIAGDILADVVCAIEQARGPFDPELVVTEIHHMAGGEEQA